MRNREWHASAVAWIAVAVVHALIGTWLARVTVAVRESADDDALQVEFIRRPARRTQTAAADAVRPSERALATVRERAAMSESAHGRDTATSATAPAGLASPIRPLDLRLPAPPATDAFARRDPFERAPPIDARTTRFENAWVPAGDAMRQAGFRSRAVGVALGLFGGPPVRCSEVDRRLRKPGCLPLHGQDDEDEALRRSVD